MYGQMEKRMAQSLLDSIVECWGYYYGQWDSVVHLHTEFLHSFRDESSSVDTINDKAHPEEKTRSVVRKHTRGSQQTFDCASR